MQEIDLYMDYPSKIASMLLHDEIDIGLVPVAVIPLMKEYHIYTNYCIGCEGKVASVCLFSEVPIDQVKQVLLDYQSRTSVQLARVLLRDYWKIEPEWVDAQEDFRHLIGGSTAGVVIGDRALEQRNTSSYIYDLGEYWNIMTGLPFVFAAWVSNKVLPESFVGRFNQANGVGVHDLGPVLKEQHYSAFDLEQYYTVNIRYELDDRKREGLALFLQKIAGFNL